MKKLSELLNEALELREGNITIDADVEFDDSKDQRAAETKFKIKFKKTRNGFDITGSKENVKKYILDKNGYGLDKEDAEDMFPELFEQTNLFEHVEQYESLDEAINSFKELPASWKKSIFTKLGYVGQYAGENSEIAKLEQKTKVKDLKQFEKILREMLKAEDSLLTWIEVDGKEVMGSFRFGDEYVPFLAQGISSVKVGGYRNNDSVRLTVAVDKLVSYFCQVFDITKDQIVDFAKTKTIEIKMMKEDKNRGELRNQRWKTKQEINSQDTLKVNQKNAIVKYANEKSKAIIDTIKNRINDNLDKLISDPEHYAYKIDAEIKNDVNSLISLLKDISFVQSNWNNDRNIENGRASYHVKEILKIIKKNQ